MNPSDSQEKQNAKESCYLHSKESYLNYGDESLHPVFEIEGLLSWLNQSLPPKNILTEARSRDVFENHKTYQHEVLCDFCGMQLLGIDYEILDNGKNRCQRCSKEAVETQEEFQALYLQTKQSFQEFFDVRLPDCIHVELVVEQPGPSRDFPNLRDSRLIRMSLTHPQAEGDYEVRIESGISRLGAVALFAALFTLVWQAENWNLNALQNICYQQNSKHGKSLLDALRLGMALWAATETLYFRQEKEYARHNDAMSLAGTAPEHVSYQLFKKTYPLKERKTSPFRHPFHGRVPVDLGRLDQAMKNQAEKNAG